MGKLTGQNTPQPRIQQPVINHLEPEPRIERCIPRHIGKGGQGQLLRSRLACDIGDLQHQSAADTLPLGLPPHRNFVKMQRLPRKPGTGKPQNAPLHVLSHPAAANVDESPVCVAAHHITLCQPCQRRQGNKGLSCRALDVREALNVVFKGRAYAHESILFKGAVLICRTRPAAGHACMEKNTGNR